MRTNRLFAAAMAAALTITAIPSYAVNNAPALMPAYAVDAEESVTVDGVVYICCGDHAIVTDAEGAGPEVSIAAKVSAESGDVPVTAIAAGVLSGLTELKSIHFEGSIDEWNTVSGMQSIPYGVKLYCKENGEYVTACTINVSIEDFDGVPVSGITGTINYNGTNPHVAAQWVSGNAPVTVAVPMPEEEGRYTIGHDAMNSGYFIYSDTSNGIEFNAEKTSYSKTITIDDENMVPLDYLQKDGTLITEGESLIICIPGEEVYLGGTDNGVMSYKLLRSTKEESVYRLTANKPGRFELIVNSDALETGEGVHFTVVPEVEEGTDTHCGGANIVEAPQSDVAVGDFSTMVVYGFGYQPGIKVCGEDGEWKIDSDGSFVELEQLSSSGNYTTYKLITKQICKVKPYFYLTNFGTTVDSDSVMNVYDPEEIEGLIEYPIEEPTGTRCGGAKVIEPPDTDITVGDSTYIKVWGYAYKPFVRFYNEDDSVITEAQEEYVDLEIAEQDGEYITYKLTPRKPCRFGLAFSLTNLGAVISPEDIITAREEYIPEPTESLSPVYVHGGTKLIKAPDTELVVGESTTMIIEGLVKDYNIPVTCIFDEDGTIIYDYEGEYFDFEEISREGNLVELKATAKKPCKAQPGVFLSLLGATETFDTFINVTEASGSGVKVIKKPQTELAVGQETTLTLSGTGYITTLKVFGGGSSFTYDMSGDFIKIEKVSSDGDSTTYNITPKKACRAELYFDLADSADHDLPSFSFHIVEGAPVAAAPEKEAGSSDVKGDANTDGKVNVADSVTVLQFIANQYKYPMTDGAKILADVDGIAGITGGDAIAIQKLDAGVF